jgi:hypothetical protein
MPVASKDAAYIYAPAGFLDDSKLLSSVQFSHESHSQHSALILYLEH